MLWSALMFARAERAAGTLPGPHFTPRCAWAAAAALSALGASHADAAQFAAACVSIALVAGAIGDVRSGFLFDAITLPACALALGAAIWLGNVGQAFAGVLLGAGSFGAAHVATRVAPSASVTSRRSTPSALRSVRSARRAPWPRHRSADLPLPSYAAPHAARLTWIGTWRRALPSRSG